MRNRFSYKHIPQEKCVSFFQKFHPQIFLKPELLTLNTHSVVCVCGSLCPIGLTAAAFGAFVTKLSYLHVLAQQIRSSRELLEKARGKSNLFFPPNSMED